MKKLFILFIAVAGFGVSSFGQTTSSAVSTTATIITPLAFVSTTPLAFGTISPDTGGASEVRLNYDNSRSIVSGTPKLYGLTSSASAFEVSGMPSTQISITVPVADVALTGGTPVGTPMKIVAGTWDCRVAAVTNLTPTLDGAGSLTFKLGAVLTVNQSQNTGSYTGSYNVTINYN